jgi:SAM-dependent methyltransferase
VIPLAPVAQSHSHALSLRGIAPGETVADAGDGGRPPYLDVALELLGAPPRPGARLVDLPTGRGYLAVRARSLGWDVRAYDIDPARWAYGDVVPVASADMNASLPIEEASADAVACCEGLEHVENPWHTLREVRRVLRPGGRLVVSIPNTVDFRQRMRVLRRGYVGHYVPAVPSHVNAMGTFLLAHALLRSGFAVRAVRSRYVYYPRVLTAVLAPFLRFRRSCGLPDEVRRMLSSREVLFGRMAIFLAEAVA